jgi:hypothetical protein
MRLLVYQFEGRTDCRLQQERLQHTLAVRGCNVHENTREQQNRDARISDLMGKWGYGNERHMKRDTQYV